MQAASLTGAGVGGTGQQVGFEGNAVESPGGGGEILDKLVFVSELPEMILISGEVFGGEDGGAAGEAVSESVERRTLFAGVGSRAGGVQGIRAS